jgi:parvulin-like peptidyl-prolyl isomerase
MTLTISNPSILQVGDCSIAPEELASLLVRYQMLPQLIREVLIDQAIAPMECSKQEHEQAIQQFYTVNQLTNEQQQKIWLSERGMTVNHLEALVLRQIKLNKFKQETWAAKVESYFLKRKAQLDQVTYSLLKTQDAELAQELYFCIRDDGRSFEEMARQYIRAVQFQVLGPVEVDKHPLAVQVLQKHQLGQPCHPVWVNNCFLIVRVDQVFPAQLDEPMRQRLLEELFTNWLQEQLAQTVIKMRR